MKLTRTFLPFLAVLFALSTLTFAVQPDRIAGTIGSGQMVSLGRGVHPQAQAKYDQGAVDPSFRLGYVTLLTMPTASQKKAISRLAAEQQNPKSPNYHKWLTPEQYADRFGLSKNDVQKITAWLKSQGLTVEKTARGRNYMVFSGTAAQIQSALQTEIHRYNVKGEMHYANTTAPKVPAALSGITAGFRGLHDFRPRPMGIHRSPGVHPFYNSSLFGDLIAPGDVKTIYGIDVLYAQGIDGTGQKIAVAGQTDVFLSDLADFRSGFGLSAINCTTGGSGLITACDTSNFKYVLLGTDPGVASPGNLGEADLDIEWAGATARNAQIIYVNGQTASGAFDAYYDAIDNNRAPVISLSYGTCEFLDTFFGFTDADEAELTQGNLQGITIVNSSGDTGAAECDFGGVFADNGLAVAYPASSAQVTGVGGTLLPYPQSYTNTFFGSTNGTDGGTALSYVPETAWNDDTEVANFCLLTGSPFCSGANNGVEDIVDAESAQNVIGMSASGGGISNCTTMDINSSCTGGFPRPSWQAGLVVPGRSENVRFSPDVSLMASPNFPGYIFCTQLSELGGGSGSACAPGGASGIVNGISNLSIVGGTSVSAPVFAGIVALLNQYLGASGLGNINPTLYALAADPTNGAFHPVIVGTNKMYCDPGTPSGQPASIVCPAAVPPAGHGIFGFDAANHDAATSYNLVTGLGSVDAGNLAIAWAATLSGFSLTANPNAANVIAGHSVDSSITLTPQNGFNSAVTYTCTGTGVTCTFNPSGATTTTPVVATLLTTPSMATGLTTVTVKGTAGAVSSTTTVDLTVAATDQSFTLGPSDASITVAQGASGSASLTMTPSNGFNAALTYTCVKPATLTEATCTVSPAGATTTNPVTVNVTTTAAHGQLHPPLGRGRQIWYAALLPGLLGILFAAGSKRTPRGLRMLSMIVVLGLSTMWLGACGGGNGGGGGNPDPGTPKGNYTLTINATTGGTNPVTGTTTVALTVN